MRRLDVVTYLLLAAWIGAAVAFSAWQRSHAAGWFMFQAIYLYRWNR